MEKLDPYKHKEKYENWKKLVKQTDIPRLSKYNSDIIKSYIFDMEKGINISNSSKKGSRSHVRLNTLRTRLTFLASNFDKRLKVKNITQVTEKQLHNFFSDMREGKIKRQDKKKYKSTADYVKDFKSFWHWYQKINHKKGKAIQDITTDLDTSKDRPTFVYFTEKEFRQLANRAKYEYKILMWFLHDSGIRSPTELMNVRIMDLSEDFKELNIREETSKTFGRRIKLMLCSDMIKEYVNVKGLKKNEFLFQISPRVVNQYFKRLGNKVFDGRETLGGKKFSELTLYDFRHNSACYWLPRYKSISALLYRFGWKKLDKVHYYTNMLGMSDTIQSEDLMIDTTKTELQQQMDKLAQENSLLQEKMNSISNAVQNFIYSSDPNNPTSKWQEILRGVNTLKLTSTQLKSLEVMARETR